MGHIEGVVVLPEFALRNIEISCAFNRADTTETADTWPALSSQVDRYDTPPKRTTYSRSKQFCRLTTVVLCEEDGFISPQIQRKSPVTHSYVSQPTTVSAPYRPMCNIGVPYRSITHTTSRRCIYACVCTERCE